MRLTPRVRLQTFLASRLEETTFRQLCDLRRSLIHLQPGVEPDADYRAFRRFFEGERAHVTVMRSTTGQLALPTRPRSAELGTRSPHALHNTLLPQLLRPHHPMRAHAHPTR